MQDNLWYQLRHGSREWALERMAAAYRQKPDAANIMQLGSALLLVEDYDAAWHHFQQAIQTYRWSMDSFHLGAGAADWCLVRREAAVAEWDRGLRCGYSDPARLNVPLVLYFASVLAPDLYPDVDARILLIKRADHAMAQYWPGPIAQYLLGRIDEAGLMSACVATSKWDFAHRHWVAGFYIGVREYAKGKVSKFAEAMQKASDLSDEDFDPKSGTLRAKFRPELSLARFEAGRIAAKRDDEGCAPQSA
ncbi:MAG TPA: hypothetical protein VHC22_23330 [Pirellulales bacterium]|nr:hypothetical protein [Pirellulales bacterium]